MDLQLANKKVLITASTGGIGKQIAKQFADEGATVIINGRNKETAEKTLSELKEKKMFFQQLVMLLSKKELKTSLMKFLLWVGLTYL